MTLGDGDPRVMACSRAQPGVGQNGTGKDITSKAPRQPFQSVWRWSERVRRAKDDQSGKKDEMLKKKYMLRRGEGW